MDDVRVPAREGVSTGAAPVLDDFGRVPKYELPVGAARSLGDLAEYTFFTPAILYLHGGFRDAPLADFVQHYPGDVKFFYKKFDRRLFDGLDAPSNGDPAWNYVLWAVRREAWRLLADWLVSITLTYAEDGEAAAIGEQAVRVQDPLSRLNVSARVTAFGLSGSKFKAAFASPAGLGGRPQLKFFKPDATMATFAAAWYGGANPVEARNAHRRTDAEGDGR